MSVFGGTARVACCFDATTGRLFCETVFLLFLDGAFNIFVDSFEAIFGNVSFLGSWVLADALSAELARAVTLFARFASFLSFSCNYVVLSIQMGSLHRGK